MTTWLASMTKEERNELVDVIYEVITSGGASKVGDLKHPKQIGTYLKSLAKDESKRSMIANRLADLAQADAETQRGEEQSEKQK